MGIRKFDFDSKNFNYKRGQIVVVDLGDNGVGSEQNGKRPCIVVQNNMGNRFSPTLIVAPITGQVNKKPLPTHVKLDSQKYCLEKDSTILTEQVKVISKMRCKHFIGELEESDLLRLNRSLAISLGLN